LAARALVSDHALQLIASSRLACADMLDIDVALDIVSDFHGSGKEGF
jgi:hypothetical protein